MLGKTVTDKITGFTGVVTGTCQYITGCNQALVTPPTKSDGSYVEPHWFDEQCLQIEESVPALMIENGENPGFDKAPPVR